MSKDARVEEERARYKIQFGRVFGSAPWLKTKDVKHFQAKIFKSGNSLALRLPAGLGLKPGTEMNVRVEDDTYFSFAAVDAPKRRFNIDKVWGSAAGLELIAPEDRLFEERQEPNSKIHPPSEG